jgi:hypothetical protein
MSDDTRPEDHSDIAPIELPINGFQSRIPPHLLEGKSESEQYILNEVSKMGHFIEWAAPLMVDSNQQQRKTNGSVKILKANVGDLDLKKEIARFRKFQDMFKSWWALIGGLVILVGGIASVAQLVQFAKDWIAK